jgi:hypothetical protein
LERVLLERDALDGTHLWVLGILRSEAGTWDLQEGAQQLKLDLGPEIAAALSEPMWVNEGRRCAVQGALISPPGKAPFLVVERVVTARSLGILAEAP